MPIWHIDHLKTSLGTVDIDLIKDQPNELSPRRRPCLDLPALCENLLDKVAHAQTATHDASKITYTTPVESILGSSTAPSSFRSDPFPTLFPLSRVQKV